MISHETGQDFIGNPLNRKFNRFPRIRGWLSALMGSQLIRRWPHTILPAVLIVFALLFINRQLRSRLGPEEAFSTFDFPYNQSFTELPVHRWFTNNGQWQVNGGHLVQADLEAESAKIYVPKWLPEGQPYHLAVQVTFTGDTQAAGINFNAQYPEIYSNHQLVYLSRAGEQTELIAGVVDEEEGFQPTAMIAVPADTDTYQLDLLVANDKYDLFINRQPFLEQRPLVYADGLVGLFATNGPAEFDNLSITTIDDNFRADIAAAETNAAAPTPLPDNNIPAASEGPVLYASDFSGGEANGWTPFAGDWRVENGRLTQTEANGYDLGAGFAGQTFQSYTLTATFNHVNNKGGGLLFNMAAPDQLNDAHIVRYADTSDSILYGYFNENGVFNYQGYANVTPPGTEAHTLQVISRESTYDLYVDGQKVANEIPLLRNNGHIGLVTAKSAVAFGTVEVTGLDGEPQTVVEESTVSATVEPAVATPEPTVVSVETTANGPDANIASGVVVETTGQAKPAAIIEYTGAGNAALSTAGLEGWVTISGQWNAENGQLVQSQKEGFDLAVGFADDSFAAIDLEVTIEHRDGVGAGLLFNMPAPNALQGAHMVRFADWADALVWGYFDEVGQFNGQGYAKIEPAAGTSHRLRVKSDAGSYAVFLDDQPLATGLPLFTDGGHIGLITSKTQAAFGPFKVAGGAQPAAAIAGTAASNDLFGDIETISGEWVREGTKLSQINQAVYDFSISTGVYAGVYTLETDITLPEDPDLVDAGGGILFHMPGRESRTGAHMVRFTGEGGLIWGYYDQSGAFVGQGREELSTAENSTHELKITVGATDYRITVDDQDIALNVPLKQEEGWIGLVSYRGPVTFEGINVTFGTEE